MQRPLFLLSFILFSQMAVLCQTKAPAKTPSPEITEGTIRYLVTYNWTKQLASLSYLSKQRKERATYMYGSRSEYHAYTLLHFTPTETKYEDSEERAEPDDAGYSWRKDVFFTKRNLTQNTFYDALSIQSKTYLIQDSLHCQDWKILNDLKEVAGHLCMNASWVDTLKEQKIIAWFALDIPPGGGPERLCGLPGLILEANVNDGALIISADKIEPRKLSTELDIPKKIKGKKVKEVEYIAALRKCIQEHIKEEQPFFWDIRY